MGGGTDLELVRPEAVGAIWSISIILRSPLTVDIRNSIELGMLC